MTLNKLSFLPALALTFAIASAAPAAFAAQSNNTVEIDVMTHLCNPHIKNTADFQALTNGQDTIGGFAKQVLNCPSTVLTKDMPVAGSVASPQTPFDYSVTGEHSASQMLSASMFHPEQLCETDVNKDVNGDGKIASTTCLDTSEYHFNTVSADNGRVEVQETMPPQGYHYGTLLFTPTQVDGNNDGQSLLATDDAKGLIKLDTTNDSDKVITLHVYDFVNSDNPNGYVNGMPVGTGTSTASTTPGTGSTTQSMLISQLQTLRTVVQNLEALINSLLARLNA
jgi:hypothetical protein